MGQQCTVEDGKGQDQKGEQKNGRSLHCGGSFEVPGLNKTQFKDEYQDGNLVGDKVLVARNKLTKRVDVVYKLPKAMSPSTDGQEVANQLRQIMTIEHPNICRLIEAFDDPAFVYLVYTKLEGELLGKSVIKRGLSERKVADIGFQICRALSVSSGMIPPIIHGALAPKNIIVTGQGTVVLTDLGLIDLLKPDPIHKLQKDSFAYMAPEVAGPWVQKQEQYDPSGQRFVNFPANDRGAKASAASDVWSLGAILYQLLSGKSPFDGKTILETGRNILSGKPKESKHFTGASKQAKDLILKMLLLKPKDRPPFDKLLHDSWLAEGHREQISDTPLDIEVAKNCFTVHAETNFKKNMMRLISENVPPSQIKKLEETFNKMDSNHNGMITLQELRGWVEKHPDACSQKDLDRVFEELDGDRSGQISIHEFAAATLDTQGILVHDVLWKTFSALDTNHNGRLTKDEIKAALKELNMRLGQEHIDKMSALVDTEVDGDLTFHQFCALMHEEGARDKRTGWGCSKIMKVACSTQVKTN
mmetsp:Transcript_151521/g.486244  ORF Transcript_151521/g.486244 Transcript_151521/m.486244 type:complete len:531 (-) Transcript_151521:145-1737(-)